MLLKYGVHKRGANETLLLCFRFMLRIFFGVLGIIVTTDGFHRKGSNTKVCTLVITLIPVLHCL